MPDAYFIPRQLRVRGGGNFTSDINLSAGGVDVTVTASSSGTTLVSYGVHVLTGTTATFLLDVPEVGRDLYLCSAGGATGTTYTVIVQDTTTYIYSSSGAAAARQVALNGGAAIGLYGASSALYVPFGPRGNVVFSSST